MPPLSQHQSSSITKMMVLADSGGGKTGALASLAAAGYFLHILDCDNGLDVLKNLCLNPAKPYLATDALSHIDAITVTEKMKQIAGLARPAEGKAYNKCISLMDRWKDEFMDKGSIYSWGEKDVLVIDSLTMLSNFAKNYVQAMNGRLVSGVMYESDWGEAQRHVESFLQTIYDTNLKCNVIMNCHINYIAPMGIDGKPDFSMQRGYAASLGKALSPRIARYFNTTLLLRDGKFYTKARDSIALKNTNPGRVPDTLPIETGLADYFKAVRAPVGTPSPSNSAQAKALLTTKDNAQ